MDVKEWAKLQESLLKSQLKIIREFLRRGEEPTFKPRKKARSQMSIIYDILHSSPTPLHVSEIIARAKDEFRVGGKSQFSIPQKRLYLPDTRI